MSAGRLRVDPRETSWSAIRASGPGGQNVNKVATAIELRFDIAASSLPERVKSRLATLPDARVSADGIVRIKAQRHRSQERNRDDAIARLQTLVDAAAEVHPVRVPTRPTKASQRRRVDAKVERGRVKAERRRVDG